MGVDSAPAIGVGAAEQETSRPLAGAVHWLFRTQEGILLLILIALCVALSRLSPVFASERNIFVLLSQMSMTMIAAIGMTLLLISREVDLSVGSMQAFAGVAAMQALNASSSLAIGLGVAILIGVVVGPCERRPARKRGGEPEMQRHQWQPHPPPPQPPPPPPVTFGGPRVERLKSEWPLDWRAGADIRRSTLRLAQPGQATRVSPRTRRSKSLPQAEQWYS